MHHVHSMVLELQAKHEKLVQTTAELVNEYNRREKSLDDLLNSVDRLEQNKADKQHVTQEIGIKVQKRGKQRGREGGEGRRESDRESCTRGGEIKPEFYLGWLMKKSREHENAVGNVRFRILLLIFTYTEKDTEFYQEPWLLVVQEKVMSY